MTVWILSRGERSEGGSVVAVCSSLAKAIELVAQQETYDDNDADWYPSKTSMQWWTRSGTDWVSIREHQVQ